jgi:hypothetical protein
VETHLGRLEHEQVLAVVLVEEVEVEPDAHLAAQDAAHVAFDLGLLDWPMLVPVSASREREANPKERGRGAED